jgi:hypothetical protein
VITLTGIPTLAVIIGFFSLAAGLWRIERRLDAIQPQLAPQAAGMPPRDALVAHITPLIRSGQKIEAIKIVRRTLGCTPMDAKRFVDELAAQSS